MAQLDVHAEIERLLPDNTSAEISPADVRGVLHEMVDLTIAVAARGPNDRPDTDKNVRYFLAADRDADGSGGDCFEELNKKFMCVQGRTLVQMYREDRTKDFDFDVTMVAVYDSTSKILINRSGSFFDTPADRVPVRFVRLDSQEARYGFVRRDTSPGSITNWHVGELSIWSIGGDDRFATAKQAKGPFPAFTGVETVYWKPAAKPEAGGAGYTKAEANALLAKKADLDASGKVPLSQTQTQYKYTYGYEPGQTQAPEYVIVPFAAAGYYGVEVAQNVAGVEYYLNDVGVAADSNGHFLLAQGDRLRIQATAPAGKRGLILLSQAV